MDLESFLVFVSLENRSKKVAGVFVEIPHKYNYSTKA
jgi:hypothetical protein